MTRIGRTAALAALVAGALTACGDGLPSRPDEAKFRAMSDGEKCRATAARAIMCIDELIVAQLRSIDGLDGELAGAIENDIAADKRLPKESRKQNIAVHKTSCAADPGYADAVFACWSQTECKPFATCVVQKSALVPAPKRPSEPAPIEPVPSRVPMAAPPAESAPPAKP